MCKRCEAITVATSMCEAWDFPGVIYLTYYEEEDKKIPMYCLGTGKPQYDQWIGYCPYCGRKLEEGE